MNPGVPPDRPPDETPDLADRVKLRVAQDNRDLISIYGSGLQSFQRLLQAISGMQDTSGVTVSCDKVIQINGLLFDATRAPFRVNGRKWSIGYNLAAPGAISNNVLLQNRTTQQPEQGLNLVTIEEIRYQGASVAQVETFYLSNLADTWVDFPRDVEQPIVASNDGVSRFKSFVIQIGALGGTAVFGAAAARPAYLGNVAVGSPSEVWQPDGYVLWPGEVLQVIQVTQNVSMTVTLVGKLWTFSKKIPS